MNRIEILFDKLKHGKSKALVGFVTAGDPNLEISEQLVIAMARSGLDVLELGVPFSDPTSDGPVIQRASARALQQGVTLAKVIDMTRRVRATVDIPIILFSYYNPILAYGTDAFYRDATDAGADGVLVVDLPPEESEDMTAQWPGNDLSIIRLIAPTTPAKRMTAIAKQASGFLYLVSKTGVTGSAGLDTGEVGHHVKMLQNVTQLPICVGFGISTAEHVRAVATVADGVVIGSAFEKLIEENLSDPDLPAILGNQTDFYKKAMDH